MTVLSVPEAFEKFRGRLEITATESSDAIAHHRTIRELLSSKLDVDRDFLTGSYVRDTKTKPLADVDIFVVFRDVDEKNSPTDVLLTIREVLVGRYGAENVTMDRPAVRVDFGKQDAQVVSVDVVPAIEAGKHYRIPDPIRQAWMATDPTVHAERATEANASLNGHWKPLVKMIKKWNDNQGKLLKPSFLIEVMALQLIRGSWTGTYPRELRAFFASGEERVEEVWADPAGLGSPVNEGMLANPLGIALARNALRQAEARCGEAIRLDASGRTGASLDVWQGLFGPLFAKS